jgi:hypothetical protein
VTGTDHRVATSRCGGTWSSAPADALLAADAGAFASLGGQDIGMAGVLVAPALDAFVGVKHSSTLFFAAQRRMRQFFVGGQIVQDHLDRGAVRTRRPDALERRPRGTDALAALFPPAEANSIIARRKRTVLVPPRRTIRWSFCPSCSVSLRTLTGPAIAPPRTDRTRHHIQPAQGQSAPTRDRFRSQH